YLLAAAISLVPFGRLADIYGRKRVFTYGIVVFTISSFLSAIAASAPMLIIYRVLQGIGSAMIFATGIAILISVFPLGERGRVLGITVASVYTGLSLGPFLGGFLTQYFTWRSVFLVTVPIGLSVTLLTIWKLKSEWAEAEGEKFDFTGSFIYGISLIGIMYGISLLPSTLSLWLITISIAGLSIFIVWESRIEHPVLQVDLFRVNRVFAFSNLAALINYSATFAVTFLLSLYLQYIRALSPQGAGLILVSQPIVMAAFSPMAGKLSDRIEPRVVASLGMTVTTVGLVLFATISADSSRGFIIGGLILLGFGFALFSSPNTNAIMSSVEKRYYGIASGSVGTMRLLGQMFSMGIVTLIFTMNIGKVQITPNNFPAFITSVRMAFIIFSCLCAVGIFASLARGRMLTNTLKLDTDTGSPSDRSCG
ncbi:MAG: MFS transporter, partial [Candidatus Latescibacteria bacterium]|nr:MFS transporter [Candidatus Latescibacterota bacterium]